MKTLSLPSIFKTTAVLLLFTLFGFQQANAQLNVINNTGCFIYLGELYGNGCNPCNNPNGQWVGQGFTQIGIPACLVAAVPNPGWIGVKYGVAQIPNPIFIGATSFTNNPFNGPCNQVQANSFCNGQVNALWLNANTVQFF